MELVNAYKDERETIVYTYFQGVLLLQMFIEK